jgi:hypothetical protein
MMTDQTRVRSGSSARPRVTSARAVALAVGVPVLLAMIGATGFSVIADIGQASFPVRDTIPISHGQVTAQVNSGNVTLRQAAAGPDALLTGTATYSLVRATVTTSGSGVNFNCPLHVGNCVLDTMLAVPARTGVSLSTFGGDVTVPQFTGGPLTLNTDGGNVTAGALAGPVSLSTDGGDVTASALGGSLRAVSDGGNLTIQDMDSADASVQSDGGDVSLAYDAAPDSLQVNSDGGNITVVLPPGRYNLQTNDDGGSESISNAVVDDTSAAKSIVLDSGGGNITISESPGAS